MELELSLGAGGTEGPYDFESFLGQEIMDAWKKNELLEILGTDFEGY